MKRNIEIIFPTIEIEIQPVGVGEPTRFDIVVKGVNGGFLGYCKTRSQAETWKDGVMRTVEFLKSGTKIKMINNE